MWHKCPGKVLICGGHLILNPTEKGIVFPVPNACVSSKADIKVIYSAVFTSEVTTLFFDELHLSVIDSNNSPANLLNFSVISIFKDIQFSPFETYTIHVVALQVSNSCVSIMEGTSTIPLHSKKASVELGASIPFERLAFRSLVILLWFISKYDEFFYHSTLSKRKRIMDNTYFIEIESFSDAAFYHDIPRNYCRDGMVPIWNKPIHELVKTGLGTSAAYISSLVLALSSFNCSFDTLLSQALLSHWIGQGCKGSGFDIYLSLYNGLQTNPVCLIFSQVELVLRLLPLVTQSIRILFDYNSNLFDSFSNLSSDFINFVKAVSGWEVDRFPFPKNLTLSIISTNKSEGTSTISALSPPTSSTHDINDLTEYSKWKDSNSQIISLFSKLNSSAWNINFSQQLSILFQNYRRAIQKIYKRGIPMEPKCFQPFLDHLSLIGHGISAAGIPGAGGFDSIFVLSLNETNVAKIIFDWNLDHSSDLIASVALSYCVH